MNNFFRMSMFYNGNNVEKETTFLAISRKGKKRDKRKILHSKTPM